MGFPPLGTSQECASGFLVGQDCVNFPNTLLGNEDPPQLSFYFVMVTSNNSERGRSFRPDPRAKERGVKQNTGRLTKHGA